MTAIKLDNENIGGHLTPLQILLILSKTDLMHIGNTEIFYFIIMQPTLELETVSLKPDRKTADKTAKINSDGQASRMTARPHTTSSARVSQDRTDKIATDERHA